MKKQIIDGCHHVLIEKPNQDGSNYLHKDGTTTSSGGQYRDASAHLIYEEKKKALTKVQQEILDRASHSYIQGIFSITFTLAQYSHQYAASQELRQKALIHTSPRSEWSDDALILHYDKPLEDIDEEEKQLCTKKIRITKDEIRITLFSSISYCIGPNKNEQDYDALKAMMHCVYSKLPGYNTMPGGNEPDEEWVIGAVSDMTPNNLSVKQIPLKTEHKLCIASGSFLAAAIATSIPAFLNTPGASVLTIIAIAAMAVSLGTAAAAGLYHAHQKGFFNGKQDLPKSTPEANETENIAP